MKRGSRIALSAFALLLSTAAAEMRMWTNTNGQIIEAEMVGVNAARRSVQVQLKDGKTAEILIENLSPPDKEYAKAHWASATAVPAAPPTAAFVNLPPRYASRLTSDARLKKILEGGGTADVEAAVIRSLALFKTTQNPDGSWGARSNKAAITGFVLQCLLGHGETADSAEYGDAVVKALMYLITLSKQNPHGLLTENWGGGKGGAGTYEHAIATTAIGEAYILARRGTKSLPGLRECFDTAVKLIISQQTAKGSWTYGGKEIVYNPNGTADLSLANWHFQALFVAQETSLKIDKLDSCIKKAVNYIESMQTKDGGFGGTSREQHYNQWSLSGGAAAGHLVLSGESTAAAKKGVKFLSDFLTAEPPDWDSNCNLYCWYGYTHALYLNGGPEWKNYATLVMPQVVAAQGADGSFKHGRPNWPAGDAADATYRQALCTLILETFYRCAK
jgi:Prenyltransferase and squalene oxidase repeat